MAIQLNMHIICLSRIYRKRDIRKLCIQELPSAYKPIQQFLQVDVDGDVGLVHDEDEYGKLLFRSL